MLPEKDSLVPALPVLICALLFYVPLIHSTDTPLFTRVSTTLHSLPISATCGIFGVCGAAPQLLFKTCCPASRCLQKSTSLYINQYLHRIMQHRSSFSQAPHTMSQKCGIYAINLGYHSVNVHDIITSHTRGSNKLSFLVGTAFGWWLAAYAEPFIRSHLRYQLAYSTHYHTCAEWITRIAPPLIISILHHLPAMCTDDENMKQLSKGASMSIDMYDIWQEIANMYTCIQHCKHLNEI